MSKAISIQRTVYPITMNIEVHKFSGSAHIHILRPDGVQRVMLNFEEIRLMADALTEIADAYEKEKK